VSKRSNNNTKDHDNPPSVPGVSLVSHAVGHGRSGRLGVWKPSSSVEILKVVLKGYLSLLTD
jgi:hypothetical protein